MDLSYRTAQLYAEAIIFNRVTITATLKKLGDLDAKKIQVVTWTGQALPVVFPQKWLATIDNALTIYRQEYGDSQYLTIYHRYAKKYNVTQITAYEGISKRLYQNRRVEFLSILVSLAVQNGLIKIKPGL